MTTTNSNKRSRAPWIVGGGLILVLVFGLGWFFFGPKSSGNIPESALPDGTHMGGLTLNVHDLEIMRSYYQEAVGLEVLEESEEQVSLGSDHALITLVADNTGEETSTPTDAGLYHSAILYADEPALANTIANIAAVAPQSYQGSADHAVSHAFYFLDPEGNGLELYLDTPENDWEWIDGQVQMGSAPLDPNQFIAEHLDPAVGLAEGTTMGHVHMKVGNLAQAEAFYADTLGFAVTSRANGALFYSAAGYHHHLATNIWESPQAGERTNPTGLNAISIVLPDTAALEEVSERLTVSSYDFETNDSGIMVQDPWGNNVIISTTD